MTSITWDGSNSVKVKIIDDQHKHFVELLNRLYKCLESDNTDELPKLITELVSYANHHFDTEEAIFDKLGYPDAATHKAVHKELLKKVEGFLTRTDDPKKIAFDLVYFLEKWFLLHLNGMDKKYTKFFNEHGLR